jgi:hypothetical protein
MTKAKALTALNKAIAKMPEFRALEKLLGHNEAISACTVFEKEVTSKLTPNVVYEGLTSKSKKERPYLLVCCGEEYFQSNKTIEDLAKEVQEAINNCPATEKDDTDEWRRPLAISMYLSEKLNWDKTDEVFPHMRMESVGTFKVKL